MMFPGVTVAVADVSVVERVDVKQGVVVIPWVPMEAPSLVVLPPPSDSRAWRELSALMAA